MPNPDNREQNNKKWIVKQMNLGAEIVDIGIDNSRLARSKYYKLEKDEIEKKGLPYNKYE